MQYDDDIKEMPSDQDLNEQQEPQILNDTPRSGTEENKEETLNEDPHAMDVEVTD